MRVCNDFQRGITCTHATDDDGALYCSNNKCEYAEIDYKKLMEEDTHIYKREKRRIKQIR